MIFPLFNLPDVFVSLAHAHCCLILAQEKVSVFHRSTIFSICKAGDASNHILDHDYKFFFVVEIRGMVFFFRWIFPVLRAYCLSAELYSWTGLLDRWPLPFLRPGHVQKNIFRLSSTSILTSKRDNLCFSLLFFSRVHCCCSHS